MTNESVPTPSNAQKIRDAYGRWIESKGTDTSCWYELFHEEMEFNILGDNMITQVAGRPLSRRQRVRELMEYLQRDLEMLEYSIQRCIEKGDMVVSFGTSIWRVRSTGRIFRTDMAKLFTFKDGLIIHFEEFFDTAAEREAHGRTPETKTMPPLRAVPMDRG